MQWICAGENIQKKFGRPAPVPQGPNARIFNSNEPADQRGSITVLARTSSAVVTPSMTFKIPDPRRLRIPSLRA